MFVWLLQDLARKSMAINTSLIPLLTPRAITSKQLVDMRIWVLREMLLFLAIELAVQHLNRLLAWYISKSILDGILGHNGRLELILVYDFRLGIYSFVLTLLHRYAHLVWCLIILCDTAVMVLPWLISLAQSRRYCSHKIRLWLLHTCISNPFRGGWNILGASAMSLIVCLPERLLTHAGIIIFWLPVNTLVCLFIEFIFLVFLTFCIVTFRFHDFKSNEVIIVCLRTAI